MGVNRISTTARARRVVRRASAHLAHDDDDDEPLDDEALGLPQAHAAAARAQGAETHRSDEPPEPLDTVQLPPRRKARIDGSDLDAEVAVKEHERERLEPLCPRTGQCWRGAWARARRVGRGRPSRQRPRIPSRRYVADIASRIVASEPP